MSRPGRSRLRAVAVATAASLGAAGAATLAARTVLHRQAALARRRIGKPLGEAALDADRVWGKRHDGKPLRLVLLGDSLAAGLGAERAGDTLGARLAKGLARRAHRPVRLRTLAIVGSESSALAVQVDAFGEDRADVAVIVVGGNDVTHRVPASAAAARLAAAVRRLTERGIPVVVGTCPDLGALRPVPQPLRAVGSRLSHQLAVAQAQAAADAGATVVSLRHAVGPFFISNPDEMFSLDRFHPSGLGYRRTADALLPAVAVAVGLTTPAHRP